jgi:di/tricarboxylate transporter
MEADLRARFGVTVLAIRHHGESLLTDLADVPLDLGDALLIQGSGEQIGQLRRDDDFLVLDSPPVEMRRTAKSPIAIMILFGVLLVVSTRVLHVSQAMLIGAVLMVLLGVLTMTEAYKAIQWKSVFLIAGMLPLGIAMQNTGTAAFLAEQITDLVGGLGDRAVLMGIFLMTALLTEVMSNAAATVLVVPIAIDAARGIDVNPEPFVMAVVIAAATSFLMPIGHQANVLVFGPGGYKFTDYTKVGVWLNVVIFILVAIFLPIVWPL